MDYLPTRFISYATLDKVRGPALLLPGDQHGETFFVTGGEESFVTFLTGSHAGAGFAQKQAANWHGAVISAIEIEVDLQSRYRPMEIGRIAGSVVVVNGSLGLVLTESGSHGFKDKVARDVEDGKTLALEATSVGFTRWRAIVRDHERLLSIYNAEVSSVSSD